MNGKLHAVPDGHLELRLVLGTLLVLVANAVGNNFVSVEVVVCVAYVSLWKRVSIYWSQGGPTSKLAQRLKYMVCIYMTPALGAKHGLIYFFLVRALLALRLDRLGWLVGMVSMNTG